MKLIFVDETGDINFPNYFGLSCVVMDVSNYGPTKTKFQEILLDNGWDKNIEFKGSYIFSASKGDKNISVDKRIDIATQLLNLNQARANARFRFYYVKKENSQDHKKDYLKYLPRLLEKALPKNPSKKSGKNIIGLYCDERPDIKRDEVERAIGSTLFDRGYVLLEDFHFSKSCFDTVGILYADLFGYLFARIDTIADDSQLFTGLTKEQLKTNGKFRKLISSHKLIGLIKKFQAYKVIS